MLPIVVDFRIDVKEYGYEDVFSNLFIPLKAIKYC